MKKRGQFYLLTAIILATIIIGLAAVTNYVKQTSNEGNMINNARNSLQIESAKTIDYGTNQGFSNTQMQTLLTNFTNNYINYTLQRSGYFIFGTQSGLRVMVFQEDNSSVSFNDGSGDITLNQTRGLTYTHDFTPSSTTINIKINEFQYNFELSKSENYFFVLSDENSGGNYIVTG